MVVKVNIWNYHSLESNVGHASLNIGGNLYISWWPQSGKRGRALVRKVPAVRMTYDEDCKKEGGIEDMSVNVLGDINEAAIRRWWQQLLQSGKEYHLTNFNCCTVVYEALKAGGALNRLTMDRRQFWRESRLWLPHNITDFSMELRT